MTPAFISVRNRKIQLLPVLNHFGIFPLGGWEISDSLKSVGGKCDSILLSRTAVESFSLIDDEETVV